MPPVSSGTSGTLIMKEAIPPDGSLTMERDDLALLTPKKGTRCLFFTGKGGVGTSTIAVATAVYLAGKGYRTRVLTTDSASHLPELFGQLLGEEPPRVAGVEDLTATRLDPEVTWKEYTARVLDTMKDRAGETKRAVQEDPGSSCAEEMAAFEKFTSQSSSTPHRGHTLQLPEMPSY